MLKLSDHTIQDSMNEGNLHTLRSLRTPVAGKMLAKILIVLGCLFIAVLFFPWQQNIRGTDKVTALSPENRPQTVESVITGRVQKWYVMEGDFVSKGDTIVTISEVKEKYFDPKLIDRLTQQIEAKEQSLLSKNDKAQSLRKQIQVLKEGMALKIDQSRAKLRAEQVRFQNAENQFNRNKKLYEAGNIPLTKFQEVEYKYQGAKADFENATLELARVESEYMDKINKAESDLNNTLSDAFDTEAEIAKYRNELSNTTIRQEQYQIRAPQSGFVVKTLRAGIGETIKEAEALCTIMPQTSDVAVEMYVRAMDVPLIAAGRKVRVQFDGWPALQFSGWPSVSVGTFGGEVKVIDYVSSVNGEFRVLIVPDKTDESWPPQLRVGSGTKGWIMLDDVPIWYELWRQLNGFPPTLYQEPLQQVLDKGKKK